MSRFVSVGMLLDGFSLVSIVYVCDIRPSIIIISLV